MKEVWRDTLLDNYTCCNILWKGHVFGINHNDTTSRIGPLYCFDVLTGKKKWEQKAAGGAFTLVDGKFLTFTGEQAILIEASTEEYKELARSQKLFLPAEISYPYSQEFPVSRQENGPICREDTPAASGGLFARVFGPPCVAPRLSLVLLDAL